MVDKKLNSLAPTGNAEFIDNYSDYIENALDEKEDNDLKYKNKNIAVMGNYGSGKSSIVKTFFNKNKKYNILNVSLGSYIENSNEDNFNDIEHSILQQIIYTVRPGDIPYSRYDRIDVSNDKKNDEIFNLVEIIIIILFIIGFCFLFFKFHKNIFNEFSGIVSLILSLLVMSSLLALLSRPLEYLLFKLNANKIKLKIYDDLEVECDCSSSVLNRNIEELITFFINTSYDIVVFEDIDRLKEKSKLFNKLKEINQIINNSIEDKTIRFIYCVGDNIFENGEIRTKFFDIIIPVIPYFGKGNIIDVFSKRINDAKLLGYNFPDINDAIKYASNFIENTREVDAIINEYKVFSINLPEMNKELKEQLLLLMFYKVLYPTKYVMLLEGKGILYEFFSITFIGDFRKYKLKSLEDEIVDLKEKLNLKLKFKKITNDDLFDMLKVNVKRYFPNVSFDNIKIILNKTNKSVCSLEQFFANIDEYIELIEAPIYLKNDLNGSTIDEKDCFSFCQDKDLFLKIIIINNEYNGIQDIQYQIRRNEDKIKKYNFNDFSSLEKLNYLKTKYSNEQKQDDLICDTDLFDEFLITSGIITSDYKRLINLKHDNSIGIPDENILSSIRKKILLRKGDYEINSIDLLFDNLTIYDFSNDSICLEEIFVYLLKKGNMDDYLNQFFYNTSVYKVEFIINLQKNGIKIFDKLGNYIIDLFNFVDDKCDELGNFIFDFIKYTLNSKVLPLDKLNHEDYSLIYVYITATSGFFEYMENNISEFKICLPNYKGKIVFDNEFIPKNKCKNIKKIIYDNDMYEDNIYSLELLSEVLDFDFDSDRIFETTINVDKDKYAYKLIYDNVSKTIDDLFKFNEIQKDCYDTIINIINTFELNNDDVLKLMSIEENKIKKIKDVSSDYYNTLLDNDLYDVTWDNLNDFYIFDNNLLDDNLIAVIKENIKQLISEKYDFERNNSIRVALLKLGLDDLKEINEYLIKNRIFHGNLSYPVNIIKLIINNFSLELKTEEELNSFLSKSDFSNEDKAKVLVTSFNYIGDFELNDISNDIIEFILNSDRLLLQQKIEFCEKYFVDNTNHQVNLSLFSLLDNNDIDISYSLFYEVISSNSIPEFNKIKLFNKYYDRFGVDKIDKILDVMGEKSSKILANNLFSMKKNNDNELFLNILSKNGFLTVNKNSQKRKNTLWISYKK